MERLVHQENVSNRQKYFEMCPKYFLTCIFCSLIIIIPLVQSSKLILKNQGISDITGINISSNVTEVSFESNNIKQIPKNYFKNLPVLHKIKFNMNKVKIIDDHCFVNLTGLLDLRLQRNKLEIITVNMLKGLHSLKKLHLYRNHIHTIELMAFSDLTNLNVLRLQTNKLKIINEGVFDTSNHPLFLNYFAIGNNPLLHCDCKMLWILRADGDWLMMISKNNTICNTPKKIHGLSWSNITETDLFGHGMFVPKCVKHVLLSVCTITCTTNMNDFYAICKNNAPWWVHGQILTN